MTPEPAQPAESPEARALFTAFREVYAASEPRDLKAFAKALASFNTLYRRASEADQGSYHAAVAQWMLAASTARPTERDPVRMREAIESAVKVLRGNTWGGEFDAQDRLTVAAELEEAINGTYAGAGEAIAYDRDGPR